MLVKWVEIIQITQFCLVMARFPLGSELENTTAVNEMAEPVESVARPAGGGGNVSFDVSGQIEEIFEAEADAAAEAAPATTKAVESEDDDMASGDCFAFLLSSLLKWVLRHR